MSSYYGTNAKVIISTGVTPATALNAGNNGGTVRTVNDKYQAPGAIAVASLIFLGRIPKGAVPLGGSIRYSGAQTGTLTIGFTGATSALGTATALATTPTQRLYPSSSQWKTPLTAQVDVYATLAGHGFVTGDSLCFEYEYAKE